MSINYLTDSNGNAIAVQIPINDWVALLAKYPHIDADLPNLFLLQQEEVLRRKEYYDGNLEELLTWEHVKKRLHQN